MDPMNAPAILVGQELCTTAQPVLLVSTIHTVVKWRAQLAKLESIQIWPMHPLTAYRVRQAILVGRELQETVNRVLPENLKRALGLQSAHIVELANIQCQCMHQASVCGVLQTHTRPLPANQRQHARATRGRAVPTVVRVRRAWVAHTKWTQEILNAKHAQTIRTLPTQALHAFAMLVGLA